MPKEEDVKRFPNTFVLFVNKYKDKDIHPDQLGYFTDSKGKVWRLAGWTKETKNGRSKYISGKISEFNIRDREKAEEKPMPDLPI